MHRMILCVASALLLVQALPTAAQAQTPAPAAAPRASATFVPAAPQNGPMPTIAFDVTKADIDFVLKNAPANPPDRQLRVVDMGKYNLGVGIVNRGPTQGKRANQLVFPAASTIPPRNSPPVSKSRIAASNAAGLKCM